MNRKALFSAVAGMLVAFPAIQANTTESYEVVTLDARTSRSDCRHGEVIVKFKSGSRANVRSRNAASTGVDAVDEIFRKLGVSSAESLMPLTGSQTFQRKMRSYSGREVATPSFDKAYLIKISDTFRVEEAVEMLSAVADVEFAEPNYLVHALGSESDDINDPYYSMQYGIQDINLYKLWGAPVISKEGPIIAVIDTGVDISHPDLRGNIWVNQAESDGATGYDDDRNGYIDDLQGYDFVNQTGEITDYNGHGTHCAGIAAATGYNGLGIIGANPDARIMPLTALQSNGTGDVATIIKAIDYAAANGAQIISMSLGTYGSSIAFEQALGRAYQKSVIVAAAGNDGFCLNHPHPEKAQRFPKPMFPAAYTFVLGVQASTQGGALAGFSNYDDNGPVFTEYGDEQLYNYELTAPGSRIMSTYPNGQYKRLNGTSMATPLVAGALSRLLQAKEYTNREELFGDLIHTSKNGILDIYAAYCISDADRTPSLQFIGNRMADADGDGRADAGEIIEFYPSIRNGWGNAADIKLTLESAEPVSSFCEFLDTEADFGNTLSSYGKGESANPLRIRINDNVVDGRVCRLKLTASCPDAPTVEQEFEFKVENGVEIGGMIEHDMILEPGVSYIITKGLVIPDGVTLRVHPGAILKFSEKISIASTYGATVIIEGTPQNPIVITNRDNIGQARIFCNLSNVIAKYCRFENVELIYSGGHFKFENCTIKNCGVDRLFVVKDSNITGCYDAYIGFLDPYTLELSNVINNTPDEGKPIVEIGTNRTDIDFIVNNNIFNCVSDRPIYFTIKGDRIGKIFQFPGASYFGTANKDIVNTRLEGLNNPFTPNALYGFDLTNILTRPVPEAHGIVWKVVVDGYDAQDEYEQLPPLGVGRHKFEVYYSKVIDESEPPMIAMGVRPPYTQTSIATDGSWRTENLPFSPLVNDRGQTEVKCGDMGNNYNYYWECEGCLRSTTSGGSDTGFNDLYLYSYSHKEGVPNKLYQRVLGAQNGRYKLRISAKVDKLADNNKCQYVFLNDSKVYLDENALNGAIYEVVADVRNNVIEVGIEQTENIASNMYIDNVSLTLLEEYSNERIEPVSVYTAYVDITGKMNIDGVNRIYVSGGRDLEMFEIPIEDKRFNVNVQAAGSLSTGFFGEAGLGRVTLTWEDLDMNFEDIMGD